MSQPTSASIGLSQIGFALRRPEEMAIKWRDRALPGAAPPDRRVFPALFASAVLGLAAYGLTMGLHKGGEAMLLAAFKAPLACGTAWGLALPALYILNSHLGSKLDFMTTALAALTTASFGALAMLASVPINWFFTLALPFTATRLLVHGVVFGGVGIAMSDVFLRVMKALEPERGLGFPVMWLGLLAVIGSELMLILDLFAM